ncbi:MAG: methionine--tRNA ligase [Deltaproteobacteria bacterium]|nr:methionine--tRNA ligase [Deltaproteobacteria bacterium]MBW2398813.1 methionine--tRNA ligase [Deltaproteobacteria bacterium]MBW2666662.1 methionine--tRNA ligase [Deltaproteobacteria bacterium]
MSSCYITTPIYYVNAEPHIGHTYTTVLADTIARYHRLTGDETFFLTGTDEHGEKIAEVAAQRGVSPQEISDQNSDAFRSTWDRLGFSYDRFIRTTDPDHVETVQRILQQVHDAGDIYFKEYDGLYCVGCERFLTERDIEDGLCKDHERAPEQRVESNYFFKMSEHFEWLAGHIEANPDFIRPERYKNEALAMLRDESGLGDLCISRPKERLEWGIELPFDANYVCYVWFDALINYLTGAGYPDGPKFSERWASAQHFVAKDILKPHAIFWPIMLRAIGLEPYRHLNVHGYWNVDARKVSKSLGNMISPLAMQEQYGFEAFRFFLLRDMVFGLDSNFSEEALVARVNSDLANNLGNLVSRTLNMTARYAGACVPACGPTDVLEDEVAAAVPVAAGKVAQHMQRCEIHRALEAIFELVDVVNRYLEQRAPWKAAKQEGTEQLVATTLYTSCEALRCIALLLAPFLPATSATILERLGLAGALDGAHILDDACAWGRSKAGTPTTKGAALFPRLDPPAREDA